MRATAEVIARSREETARVNLEAEDLMAMALVAPGSSEQGGAAGSTGKSIELERVKAIGQSTNVQQRMREIKAKVEAAHVEFLTDLETVRTDANTESISALITKLSTTKATALACLASKDSQLVDIRKSITDCQTLHLLATIRK